MYKLRCIQKIRDNKGRIKLYVLKESNNTSFTAKADEVKKGISLGIYEITNLQIDKLGRIINKKEKPEVKIDQPENNISSALEINDRNRYTLVAMGVTSDTGDSDSVYYLKVRDNTTGKEVWMSDDIIRAKLKYSKSFTNLSIRKRDGLIIKEDIPIIDISSLLFVKMSIEKNIKRLLEDIMFYGSFVLTTDSELIPSGNKKNKKEIQETLKRLREALEKTELDECLEDMIVDAVSDLYDRRDVYYGYLKINESTFSDICLSFHEDDIINFLKEAYVEELNAMEGIDIMFGDELDMIQLIAEISSESKKRLKNELNTIREKIINTKFFDARQSDFTEFDSNGKELWEKTEFIGGKDIGWLV